MVHRRLFYIYLLNVPSFSSRYFNKIKLTSRLGRLLALSLEILSTVTLIYSRRVVVSYKRKYVHELLVNRLFKPAQEKVWLGELTVPQ